MSTSSSKQKQNSSPLVAVVILNWNGVALLEQFLPSLLASTYDNMDLIVADNASSDDSIAFLRREYPTLRIIETGDNWGFAGGYNRALKEVEADYYVLLNSDVEVTPGWIEPIIAGMEQDATVGLAMPKIRWQKHKEQLEYAGAAGGMMDWLGYSFCRGRMFNENELDEGQYDDPIEIFWATGCSLFIRANLYHQLGGLDDDFFAHMEEIDLCWRAKNAGYKIFCYPDSVVYHVGGATLEVGSPRKTFLNFRNNLAMLLKNWTGSQLITRLLPRLVLDGVAAIYFLISGNPKHLMAVWKAHWTFFIQIPKWWQHRKAAAEKIEACRIGEKNETGIYQKSIVWQFYQTKKRRYSELPVDGWK